MNGAGRSHQPIIICKLTDQRKGQSKMWEAVAEYKDGTNVRKLFNDSTTKSDNEMQYDLECWLLNRHENCIWYSVNYIWENEYE